MTPHFSLIEPLESRIAPAILINARTVSYLDIDGDQVLIKTSRPIFTSEAIANSILHFSAGSVNGSNSVGQQLQTIDLTGSGQSPAQAVAMRALANGTSISVTAQAVLGVGNGVANVGYIKAALVDVSHFDFFNNIDLGRVKVDGDLGRIDAGDSISDPAIRALRVGSMGRLDTQDPNNVSYQSNILGPIGTLHTTGDIDGAFISVVGGQFGRIGKVEIEGALRGNANQNSGQITFTGKINSFVAGSIIGGDGPQSGAVIGNLNNSARPTAIKSVHVLGSVIGGGGTDSGEIAAYRLSSVRIEGDVIGGANGIESGFILGRSSLGRVEIAGSLIGGGQTSAGGIFTNGNVKLVQIGQDITGGDGISSANISAANIKRVQIGGDLTGGSTTESGEIIVSGSIRNLSITGDVNGGDGSFSGGIFASNTIRSLSIGGDLSGGGGASSGRVFAGSIANLSIGGDVQGGSEADSGEVLAGLLGTVQIGGDVQGGGSNFAGSILAARIGNLTLIGSLIGGGATQTGLIGGDSATLFAKIGSLTPGLILNLRILGDVQGGAGNTSGAILTSGSIEVATIVGDLMGGNVDRSTALLNSGTIQAAHIGALTVGNVTAGSNAGTGGIANSGAIRAGVDIVSLTINGNLQGAAGNNAIISAAGFGSGRPAGATTDIAIGSVIINGNVDRAEILAGYASNGTAAAQRGGLANGDAQINLVRVNGNLSATSIVAGANPGEGFFGNADDTVGAGTSDTILSKIAAVIITGTATGSADSGEHFGIDAQTVEAVSVNGSALSLTSGPDDLPISANFRVHEV